MYRSERGCSKKVNKNNKNNKKKKRKMGNEMLRSAQEKALKLQKGKFWAVLTSLTAIKN